MEEIPGINASSSDSGDADSTELVTAVTIKIGTKSTRSHIKNQRTRRVKDIMNAVRDIGIPGRVVFQ